MGEPVRTVLVRYRGDVQGVGFRATVRAIAQEFDLKGWVKNEADGSVSMIASGPPQRLEAFLQAIRDSRLGNRIEREELEPQPASFDPGAGFGIRR